MKKDTEEKRIYPYKIIDLNNRDEWLSYRSLGLGGSDASSVVGMNNYRTNVQLWEEKTGLREPDDISGRAYVQYGVNAEPLIRSLFALDYPEMTVEYHPHRILRSTVEPFMTASLDGELTDPEGRRGILEIKTSNIIQNSQYEKWKDQIPGAYYCQLLHYFVVTGYDFAILRAHLNSSWGTDRRTSIRHYFIEKESVKEDMEYLTDCERKFWKCVESRTRPNLVLPSI